MRATHRQNIDQKTLKSQSRAVHVQRCVLYYIASLARTIHIQNHLPHNNVLLETYQEIVPHQVRCFFTWLPLMFFVPRPLPFLIRTFGWVIE